MKSLESVRKQRRILHRVQTRSMISFKTWRIDKEICVWKSNKNWLINSSLFLHSIKSFVSPIEVLVFSFNLLSFHFIYKWRTDLPCVWKPFFLLHIWTYNCTNIRIRKRLSLASFNFALISVHCNKLSR